MTVKEFKGITENYLNQIKLENCVLTLSSKKLLTIRNRSAISQSSVDELYFLTNYIDTLKDGLHSHYKSENKRKGIDNLYNNTLIKMQLFQRWCDSCIKYKQSGLNH